MKSVPFADLLRNAREKAGITQYALAKKTGLSAQAIAVLERGGRDPSWTTIQKLALALGVDCRAFTDPGMALPEPAAPKPRGRPRKTALEPPKRRGKK
jgi:transcriptional regulator with XRE-family HTH domain